MAARAPDCVPIIRFCTTMWTDIRRNEQKAIWRVFPEAIGLNEAQTMMGWAGAIARESCPARRLPPFNTSKDNRKNAAQRSARQSTKTQNMALTEKINEDIKAAMRAKDKRSLEALRAIKSALMLEATKADKSATTEADEMKLLTRLLKQRKDSEQIYREQQRDDLADEEAFQASVIGNYLPESLAPEEIEKIVLEIIASTGATGMKDMGKVMGAANAKMAGRADGKVIADLVKAKLGSA